MYDILSQVIMDYLQNFKICDNHNKWKKMEGLKENPVIFTGLKKCLIFLIHCSVCFSPLYSL